jgi:hypothetical protein
VAERWRQALQGSPEDAIRVAIPDCVDEAIFCLLDAIDQGILQLSFKAESGEVFDLAEDGAGELGGWYIGSGGWRARYSTERFVDDFKDLSTDNP